MSKIKWALLEKYFVTIHLWNRDDAFFHNARFEATLTKKHIVCLRNESANKYPRCSDSHVERSPNDHEYL